MTTTKSPKGGHYLPSRWLGRWAALLLFCLCLPAQAETTRIAIVIDDLGTSLRHGLRTLELPGALTFAFLPYAPHSRDLAEQAYQSQHEIMLHMPMAAMEHNPLGPGALTLDMTHEEFDLALDKALAAVPHASGVNNHMGSLLTRHPGDMQWLMEALKRKGGLFFLDSRTTRHTVAEQVARENKLPTLRRDVFLDDDPSPEAIAAQFQRLLRKARHQGSAIAIGHPRESTLSFLEKILPLLPKMGVQLVPLSTLLPQKTESDQPIPRLAQPEPEEHGKQLVYFQTDEPGEKRDQRATR